MLSRLVLYQPEVLYAVVGQYNMVLWPAQIAALLLGLFAVALLWRRSSGMPNRGMGDGVIGARVIGAILAAGWAVSGVAWLGDHYAQINWAGEYYRWAFLLQAALLLGLVTGLRRLRFHFVADAPGWLALALALFAVLVHPLLELGLGRSWAQLQLAGLMPDPTAALTVALLAFARAGAAKAGGPAPGWTLAALLAVPVLWCLLSGAWAWLLDTPERAILPAAGLLGAALALWRRRRQARARGAEAG